MKESYLSKLKRLDINILVVTVLLAIFGLVMIASATRGGVKGVPPTYFISRQLLWIVIGYLVFFFLSLINIRKFESFSLIFYFVVNILLLAVLFVGSKRLGAARWIDIGPFTTQPSEFAKVAILLLLASLLSRIKDREPYLLELVQSLFITAIPAALIFLQPDLGTTIVLFVGWLACIYAGGAKIEHMILFLLLFALLFGGAVKLGLLRDYQLKRLTVFLNPESDLNGPGYNIVQAKIAVGSGGFKGKGIFSGTQSALRFVPERQTDFIFSVIAEETGFVGCVFLMFLYFWLLSRLLMMSGTITERTGKIFTFAYACVLLFHILVNAGMNLGIMPVTGIPLPFVSYGGSFFLVNMICLGIVQSFWIHRKPV
jgi:rod shape determining protein RodA